MTSTQKFKILAIVPKLDGKGEFFTKVGIAFRNKDNSINGFLEMLPLQALNGKPVKLQIREWDERDERPREGFRSSSREVVTGQVSMAGEVSMAGDVGMAGELGMSAGSSDTNSLPF